MKAVIFDCDGTLVESEDFHFLAWQAALQKKGYTWTKEDYIQHFVGLGDLETSKVITQTLKIADCGTLLNDKNAFFESYQTAGIPPIASTVAFVRELFKAKEKYGYKLAVASGAKKREILKNLKDVNIDHCFSVILSGRDDLAEYQDPEGTNKPKPYVYLKAANELGLKAEECIAIEDSKTGVTSARSAGCFTIAIPNEYTCAQDLSQAHLKLHSFKDLSVEEFFKMVEKGKA